MRDLEPLRAEEGDRERSGSYLMGNKITVHVGLPWSISLQHYKVEGDETVAGLRRKIQKRAKRQARRPFFARVHIHMNRRYASRDQATLMLARGEFELAYELAEDGVSALHGEVIPEGSLRDALDQTGREVKMPAPTDTLWVVPRASPFDSSYDHLPLSSDSGSDMDLDADDVSW